MTHSSGVLMDMLPRRALNTRATITMIPMSIHVATIKMTATTPPTMATVLSLDVVGGSRVEHSLSLKLEMVTEH